jgi:hypothetical protein
MKQSFGLVICLAATVHCLSAAAGSAEFQPLIPDDSLAGWHYSDWSNLATPQKVEGTPWEMQDGVLVGLGKRTWIFSEKEYGDFVLRFDWQISEGANGGVGLRFPPEGDPAFTGMEIQIVDGERYYRGKGDAAQLTGSIYNEIAPKNAKVKPVGEWNSYEITCRGSRVKIVLNGETVIDTNLSDDQGIADGAPPNTKPLANRPQRGRIGFQNLSGTIRMRRPEIRMLD